MNRPKDGPSVSILLPAFNEAEGIGPLLQEIKATMDSSGWSYEMVVIDDASTDDTAAVAKAEGARTISHPYNKGNGATVKTGIREAYGEIIVLLDADGQHVPKDIPRLIELTAKYDLVVGARNASSPQALPRRLMNQFYNRFASYITGVKVGDLTSGFRAVRADLARRYIHLLPNTFSYPTTMTMAFIKGGLNVHFFPITARKRQAGHSKIHLVSDGSRFFIILFKIATLFSPLKVFLPLSLLLFTIGLGYTAYTLTAFTDFRNLSVVIFMFAVVVFSLGLISEQISQLRMASTDEDIHISVTQEGSNPNGAPKEE